MKGKDRSPVKAKRSRGAEESSRERCGKKLSSTSCDSGTAAKSSESSSSGRRGLHLDKGLSGNRDYEASARAPGMHTYGSPVASSGSGGSSKGADGRAGAVPRSSEGRGEAEYKSLRISELGSSLSDEAVEDGLFHEFKKFGDVSVKISRSGDERVALVNFRRPEDARAAKHARGRLVLYDRPLKIEAVYTTGSRRRSRSPGDKEPYSSLSAGVSSLASHRHPHGQRGLSPGGLGYRDYRLQQLALGRLPPPPPPPLPRDLDRDRDYNFYESRIRPAYPLDPRLNIREDDSSENDIRANRTLFLGNLDINVTESELRRAFERFGTITEVDIKRATRGQSSTYGFIKFENLDMAQRAKLAMSGKPILRNCIKIGYGKATPTNRLWVGGLGHWVPMASLAREFDRFGTIRSIDYRKGDSWAYIQYESLDAAQAACSQMRGFPLGGDHRRLRVDFADTDHVYQPPYLQPLPLPHYDLVGDAFAPRAPDSLRARDRTSPLLYRERERDLYGDSDWVPLPIRDRNRVPYGSLEALDRRVDGWSLDRERERDGVNKEQPRKRRLIDEARHVDRSPESERARKRHCASPDRSPNGSGGRDGRYNDTDRANSRTEQPSPSRDWRGSLERGVESKHDRKNSNSVERDRKHRIGDNKSPLRKDERLESSSKVKSLQKQDANQNLCLAWQGMLLLKNSNFPSNMHLLQGDLAVATSLLIEGPTGGKVVQLKITQRLRLDQPKLDEVTRRIKVAGPNGYAVLLAVPGTTESNFTGDQASSTQRPLRNLVSYLKQKQAAGVISLPVGGTKDKENTGVLHAFPPCEFSQQFLDSTAKALAKSEDDYLVMIIVRGAS
ncbi:PREDICTED: putative RNA-binding protein 15 [Nanorana parkeri]|uniref:putative RNA-binding protein 15 n=1 Tax=Nanorana parkeri TaxID=125878 RepID=UPI0008544E2F|nr:PREDICTED: putative RNA-binding protein 15 [Nanorana parkeri]XP_018412763.1 PREDICTED: putative RNA-binding protein 15 [Nanorana parkeri]